MGPTGPGGPREGTKGIMPEGPFFVNVEIRDEGFQEGRGGAWCRKQFEERMAESFPHLLKCIHLPSQDQQTKKSVLAHIRVKLLETEDRELVLDVDRETSHIVSKEKKQPEDLDVPSETVEPRGDHASWSGVFGGWKTRPSGPGPAEAAFRTGGEGTETSQGKVAWEPLCQLHSFLWAFRYSDIKS